MSGGGWAISMRRVVCDEEPAMRWTAWRRRLALAAAGVVLLTAGRPLEAESTERVQVRFLAIRATTRNADISPELKGIAEKLKQQFKFTGFKLEHQASGTTPLERTWGGTLIGPYATAITPKKVEGKRIQIHVLVTKSGEKKPVMDATLTITASEFALSGGWPLDGGDALIMAVAVR